MSVTLRGKANKHQSKKEGHYILQTDPVNEKPSWIQENGRYAIWRDKNGLWGVGDKENLGGTKVGIYSPDKVEDPCQAFTWKYFDKEWHESKDIVVARSGNIYIQCDRSASYRRS